MCALKKSSAPSFGVKLFVSLVMLGISLCFVGCTSSTNPPVADKEPTAPVASIAEKAVTVTIADFLGKVNEDPKLKYQPSDAEVNTRIGKLEEVIPAGSKPAAGSNEFKSYHEVPSGQAEPTFNFFLHKQMPFDKFLEAHKEALTAAGKKGDAEFKKALESALVNPIEFLEKQTFTTESGEFITKSLQEVENSLYGAFKLENGKIVKGSAQNSNQTTLLLAPVDSLKKIKAEVYLDKATIVEFLEECAKARGNVEGDDGDVKFMVKIIEKLSETPEGKHKFLWADVLSETANFYFVDKKIERKDAGDKDKAFDYEGLRKSNATYNSKKIFIPFAKVEGLNLGQYSETLSSESKGESIGEYFAELIQKTQSKTAFDSSYVWTPVSKADLQKALHGILKPITVDIEVAAADFKGPTKDDKKASSDDKEIKFTGIPYKKEGEEPKEIDILANYIKFIKGKVTVTEPKEKVTEQFFTLCWSEASFTEYSSKHLTAPVPTVLPGDQTQQPQDQTQQSQDQTQQLQGANQTTNAGAKTPSKSKKTIIIVSFCVAALFVAIVGAVALFMRQKKSEDKI